MSLFLVEGILTCSFPHLFPSDALTLKARCCKNCFREGKHSLWHHANPLTARLCICRFFHLSFCYQGPLCSERCSCDFVISINLFHLFFGQYSVTQKHIVYSSVLSTTVCHFGHGCWTAEGSRRESVYSKTAVKRKAGFLGSFFNVTSFTVFSLFISFASFVFSNILYCTPPVLQS